MRLLKTFPLALLLLVAACADDERATPTEPGMNRMKAGAADDHIPDSVLPGAGHFAAILSKEDAGTDSRGRGTATFSLSEDGMSVDYRLIVANIENVTMAHIHIAEPGSNGPIAVWLFPDGPPPTLVEGRVNGVLAEGTITAEDLMGPLEGLTVMDLAEQLWAGMGYVNVHTEQFGGGEIRGQIDRP